MIDWLGFGASLAHVNVNVNVNVKSENDVINYQF